MSGVHNAVDVLRAGGVVVLPTDTVYGLAAEVNHPEAIGRLFEIKGRPRDKALPVLAATLEDVRKVAVLSDVAIRAAADFWPGSLTLVLRRAPGFAVDLGGPRDSTVAVRIPDCAVTLRILEQTGPLAVTSANRSGLPPALDAKQARSAVGDVVDAIVDAGASRGTPSTVISLVGEPRVLRAGALSGESVAQVLAGE